MIRSLVLAAALAVAPLAAQDHYGVGIAKMPAATVVAVWPTMDGPPVVLLDQGGLVPLFIKAPDPSHLKAEYVSTGGALITVYVDCTKLTSDECVTVFKRRFEQMTAFLKLDPEATARWREARKEK